MFEELTKYKRIIVTGPQRSGTRICAQMIAKDTGYVYIDEGVIAIDSFYALVEVISHTEVVVQCPALCRYVHHLGANEDLLIVMMVRDIDDIITSQKRIDWQGESIELMRYAPFQGSIAELKYIAWKSQKKFIKNWMEIDYNSLSGHPMWIPKEERSDFTPHQTTRTDDA